MVGGRRRLVVNPATSTATAPQDGDSRYTQEEGWVDLGNGVHKILIDHQSS